MRGNLACPVLRGLRRSNAPELPDECEFTALRYFTLDGSDYPSHDTQEAAIAGYSRWHNRRAQPKTTFAVESKIRRPDYLPNNVVCQPFDLGDPSASSPATQAGWPEP